MPDRRPVAQPPSRPAAALAMVAANGSCRAYVSRYCCPSKHRRETTGDPATGRCNASARGPGAVGPLRPGDRAAAAQRQVGAWARPARRPRPAQSTDHPYRGPRERGPGAAARPRGRRLDDPSLRHLPGPRRRVAGRRAGRRLVRRPEGRSLAHRGRDGRGAGVTKLRHQAFRFGHDQGRTRRRPSRSPSSVHPDGRGTPFRCGAAPDGRQRGGAAHGHLPRSAPPGPARRTAGPGSGPAPSARPRLAQGPDLAGRLLRSAWWQGVGPSAPGARTG